MKTEEFKQKIREYLHDLDIAKYGQFKMEADGGVWDIRTGMYEDIVEVKVSFTYGKKVLKAYVYQEGNGLHIQSF